MKSMRSGARPPMNPKMPSTLEMIEWRRLERLRSYKDESSWEDLTGEDWDKLDESHLNNMVMIYHHEGQRAVDVPLRTDVAANGLGPFKYIVLSTSFRLLVTIALMATKFHTEIVPSDKVRKESKRKPRTMIQAVQFFGYHVPDNDVQAKNIVLNTCARHVRCLQAQCSQRY